MPKKRCKPSAGGSKKTKRTVRRTKGLTASDRKQFKTLLLLRKRILLGDVTNLEAEGLRQTQGAGGELSSMPIHLADLGSDAFEQELTLGRMESESDELQEIAESLERIEDGTFGLCESCRKPIPKVRLKAIPYAKLCVACKREEEES